MLKRKLKPYKRIALALTLCAIIIWGVFGMGTSIAWFTETSNEVNNIFHFSDFDLEVFHRLENGDWDEVDSQTQIFDEEALYEPGYVQVVPLKVKNNGTSPFEFFTAVNINGYTIATNVYGQQFNLAEYLKFGVTFANSETALDNTVIDRETAKTIAHMPLSNYDTATKVLNGGEEIYIALIVRMPEDVTNVANYRGTTVPEVELGITVKADQLAN